MAVAASGNIVFELPSNREVPRLQWTRDQYHKLAENGFLGEEERYELIEGEIIPKMPQERRHLVCCTVLMLLLQSVYGLDRVQTQGPIAPDGNNEPEPDVTVLNVPVTALWDDHPGPENIVLLVEISVPTLSFDRNAKSNVYARAGVPEYWILDVNTRSLIVRRDPSPTGCQTSVTLSDDQTVSPLTAPENVLNVADMLPPTTLPLP